MSLSTTSSSTPLSSWHHPSPSSLFSSSSWSFFSLPIIFFTTSIIATPTPPRNLPPVPARVPPYTHNLPRRLPQRRPSAWAQASEMQLVREKVYAMEQTHMTLKQKYDEEISELRRQPGAHPSVAPDFERTGL
ncbi:hypothetical protein CDD80_3140 [Ophiocordyceps camponoti-rufipedis]|uniref:Transcriptional repressor Tup1 N-terminal domain-containing protein n=1 Tax=Ophiocordyceps camponoti-rufipedis TaxID=2004952 RepID=A0A2C5ZL51_9HYPO|nr:hypothetical protein CDD80_3140 [Ophiocordyceps camponoti-rufipedis]